MIFPLTYCFYDFYITIMEGTLNTLSHIDTLQERRDHLRLAIKQEMASAAHNDLKIASMKKKRLHLKDEIHMLQRRAS